MSVAELSRRKTVKKRSHCPLSQREPGRGQIRMAFLAKKNAFKLEQRGEQYQKIAGLA
jgi:hypothetical protein